jgi:hypothetical protein
VVNLTMESLNVHSRGTNVLQPAMRRSARAERKCSPSQTDNLFSKNVQIFGTERLPMMRSVAAASQAAITL